MRAHRGGRLVASIARHALPPRSAVGGLESIPVATCAKTPGRAPTSSTMATRFAATRVPLSARRPGELRPCKLAPASRAERPTRSPAHCPCASCWQVRTGGRANLSCPRHRSPMHTYHSSSRRLMLESAAFTLAMSARATSTPVESASWAHPGLANDFAPAAEFAFT